MNRLGIYGRIAVVIVLVAVASATASGMMSLFISKSRFSDYISSTDQRVAETIAKKAIAYYSRYHTLDGLQKALVPPHFPQRADQWIPPKNEAEPPHINDRDVRDHFRNRFVVTTPGGKVVADSLGLDLGHDWENKPFNLTRYPLELDNGKLIGHVYLGTRLPGRMAELQNAYYHQIRTQTLVSALIVAAFALLLGVILARRIVSPITDLTGGIHQLARGDFGVQIQPRGDRELFELGNEFNRLAQWLKDNDENRRSFLANIAHEIRTPLTIMRGELEAIQNGGIAPTEEVVSGLIDEIIRLSRLVKDFETLSLAEGGGIRLNRQWVTVEQVLESLGPLRLMMEQDDIAFTFDVSSDIASVYADSSRLTQILINLITNAIKNAGPGGKISLILRNADTGVLFAIRDNGPGIRAEELDRIFERFFQADKKEDRHSGGTGLGLAIARSFVEAHGGRIWAESKPSKETSFFFTLPRPR